MTKSHKHTNRLIDSTSPYLLQHAHNPVDWYTWGDEAFEKAVEEDKPIFLSIGYSTCHWCHVMAHESFEDEAVAKLLNENFISIKVDREERPDIDQFYMSAATTLIGRGGWPLTIVMGPDKRPFFAGTYFPKNSTARQMGMLDLLPRLVDAWNNQRPEIHAAMDQIVNSVKERSSSKAGPALNGDNLTAAVSEFMSSYDRADGGFGSAPKFPSPHNLVFLMREGYRMRKKTYVDAALHTLKEMRLGGLFDHIGYGFHRYSTDAQWHVPHFEKMLYDQATLMQAYTEAWELSGDQFYLQTVAEIFSYLTDKLITPEGAYYAAEDADSEGEEGKFYVWSWDELTDVIGTDELKTRAQSFDLKPEGNFNDEVSHQASGSNIFHLRSEEDYWASTGNPDWEQVREKLYNARETRIAPGLDNKILGDWNGLVLTALSRAAQATGDERYAQAAGNLADYIMDKLVTEDGDLLHMPDHNGQKILGFLDDYSFIVEGLRHYYELSFDPKYLAEALRLQKLQIKRFWDDAQGGFYLSAGNDDLLIRQKDVYDGAIPSGNSVAATNLYYLGRVSENPLWEEYSTKIGMVFSEQVQRAPRGFSALLQSVQTQITGSKEVVIAGSQDDLNEAIRTIRKYYDPFKLVLFRPNQGFEQIENISGFLAYQKAIEGNLTVYICEDYACQQPLTDITNLELALKANAWEMIDE